MILEQGLFAFLSADTAISAIVADRIFPLMQRGDAQPSLVYSRVAAQRTQRLCNTTDPALRGAFQIDSYAKTYEEVKELADIVRQTLVDFAGDMGGTHVSTVILDTEIDMLDPEPGLYRVLQTYFIWFVE